MSINDIPSIPSMTDISINQAKEIDRLKALLVEIRRTCKKGRLVPVNGPTHRDYGRSEMAAEVLDLIYQAEVI